MEDVHEKQTIKIISLGQDRIYTDYTGIKQLFTFYHECALVKDSTIHVDLEHITWIDGNMCAVFGAMMYKLQQENNLKFTIDFDQVEAKCNVLFRNGLITVTSSQPGHTNKSTTLPFKAFKPNEKDSFINYIYDELLTHSGMPKFSEEIKAKLTDDLSELLSNINLHAETEYPFFVCGQYYPKSNKVIFTVCDLGVGFYPKIKEKLKEKVKTSGDCILWAVNGNSTKRDTYGGINLNRMREYFIGSGGSIHIITGDAYWNSENIGTQLYPDGIIKMSKTFVGTVVHLVFNKKSLY